MAQFLTSAQKNCCLSDKNALKATHSPGPYPVSCSTCCRFKLGKSGGHLFPKAAGISKPHDCSRHRRNPQCLVPKKNNSSLLPTKHSLALNSSPANAISQNDTAFRYAPST